MQLKVEYNKTRPWKLLRTDVPTAPTRKLSTDFDAMTHQHRECMWKWLQQFVCDGGSNDTVYSVVLNNE